MKVNLRPPERALRSTAGVRTKLAALVATGGVNIWARAGVLVIATGAFKFSWPYRAREFRICGKNL